MTSYDTSAGGDDFASAQLRAFFSVLQQEVAAAARLGEAEGRSGADALSQRLCALIEEQAREAGRVAGRSGAEAAAQARYLKAALADEILLHTDWAGRQHWQHVLLEAVLFQTSQAGQRVFADIDQLLREREPAQRSQARMFLHVLALGFQGSYRDGPSLAPLAAYRRELFQFACQRAPGLGGRDAVLSEQPYASTLAHLGTRRLASLSRRYLALGLVLLILLGLSEVLWLWQSWPVRDALAAPAMAWSGAPPAKGLPC